jgi:hypothetical protein
MNTCADALHPIITLLDEIGQDPVSLSITLNHGDWSAYVSPDALGRLAQRERRAPYWRLSYAGGAHWGLDVDGVRYWCALTWEQMTAEQAAVARERMPR